MIWVSTFTFVSVSVFLCTDLAEDGQRAETWKIFCGVHKSLKSESDPTYGEVSRSASMDWRSYQSLRRRRRRRRHFDWIDDTKSRCRAPRRDCRRCHWLLNVHSEPANDSQFNYLLAVQRSMQQHPRQLPTPQSPVKLRLHLLQLRPKLHYFD